MTPDQHPTPADGQPLTRRRLREIERARAAEAERARRAAAVSAPTPAASPELPEWAEPPEFPEWAEPPAPARDLPRRRSVASPPEQRARPRASTPSEPPTVTGAQRAVGATLGRKRPRGVVAVILTALVVVAIIAVPVVLSRSGAGRILGGATAGGGGGVTLAADAPIDSALTVTGRIGSTPALSLKGVLAPPAPEQVITDVVVQGTGRTVNEGDGVLLSVSRFSGTDGANTTGSPSGRRLFFRRLDAGVVGEAIDAAVVQAAEGSRIVLRSSVESSGGRVAEVTVVDVLPTLAAGAAQTPAAGTPSVALAEDGTVSVGLTGLAAPTRSTAAVVIRGEGSQVSATDTIVARYTIVSWSGGTVRTTNYGWTAALGTIDMTDTLAGLAQGLVDVPVGSRVVLSLPADQARGDEPVAVVVDVLAIVEGGAAPSDAASAPATP